MPGFNTIVGSTVGGGSPIVISSETNEVEDLIAGVTLHLKDVSAAPVTTEVSVDKQGVKDKITDILNKYNEVMRHIDQQFSYNEETGEAGVLLGDGYLLSMQSYLRSALSGALFTLPTSMNMLASIGIHTGDGGHLMLTPTSMLFDAIDEDFAAVKNLFTNFGTSTNPLVQFLAATDKTKITTEGYEIDITQVAAQGYLQGTEIYDPAAQSIVIDSINSALKLTVNLAALYSYVVEQICVANARRETGPIDVSIDILGTVKEAWEQLPDEEKPGSAVAGETASVPAATAAEKRPVGLSLKA